MCRKLGTRGGGKDRCDACNEPSIRRDRQNLANRVKREMGAIAQENSVDTLEAPVIPATIPDVEVADIAPAINPDTSGIQEPVSESVIEPAVMPVKEVSQTLASVLADDLSSSDSNINTEDATAVIADMLASPEVGREFSKKLRDERLNAASNKEWFLNGREDTPENLATGLAERQAEIIMAGGLIAERAQAIHGVDVDKERQEWNARLKTAQVEQSITKVVNQNALMAYLDRRREHIEATGSTVFGYHDHLTDTEKEEMKNLELTRVKRQKEFEVANNELALVLRGKDAKTIEVNEKIAAANRQAVNEVRAIGNVPVKFGSSIRGVNDIDKKFSENVGAIFPDEWVKNSNESSEFIVRRVTSSTGRAHYKSATKPGYRYSTTTEPYSGDSRYDGWEKQYDENGNFTGKWAGLKRDFIEERSYRNFKKFDDNDEPKGKGWKRGYAQSKNGNLIPGWVRDNATDKKTYEQGGNPAELTVNVKATPEYQREVIQHEFSHRVEETNPHIPMMEEAFLASRTTNANGVRDRLRIFKANETTGYATRKDMETREVVRPDDFVNVYMGKEYHNNSSREVLSMGTEAVFSGSQGGLIGIGTQRADHSMRNWVLGMYAVA